MRKWIFMVTVEDNIIFYERSTGGTNDDSFFRIRDIDECVISSSSRYLEKESGVRIFSQLVVSTLI